MLTGVLCVPSTVCGRAAGSTVGVAQSRALGRAKTTHGAFLAAIFLVLQLFHFSLQKLTLRHVNSNQCLDGPSEEDKLVPSMKECAGGRSQQWLLRNMTLGA